MGPPQIVGNSHVDFNGSSADPMQGQTSFQPKGMPAEAKTSPHGCRLVQDSVQGLWERPIYIYKDCTYVYMYSSNELKRNIYIYMYIEYVHVYVPLRVHVYVY